MEYYFDVLPHPKGLGILPSPWVSNCAIITGCPDKPGFYACYFVGQRPAPFLAARPAQAKKNVDSRQTAHCKCIVKSKGIDSSNIGISLPNEINGRRFYPASASLWTQTVIESIS